MTTTVVRNNLRTSRPHPLPLSRKRARGVLKQNPANLVLSLTAGAAVLLVATASAPAADQPQWGERYSRNMVSAETGLPESFDPAAGRNVKWSIPLGGSYSTPVIAGGRVLIGCNNDEPRDPRHQGDRGVLVCLEEKTGRLCWQLVVPKLQGDIFLDWPRAGICSPATVEGDRVYIVSNRAELMCLDMKGLSDGNDGPYRDEGRHMGLPGETPMEPGQLDADILWVLDLWADVGIHPHDSAHSSVLVHGDSLYLNTGNGVDNTHQRIRAPEAPSLIVVDKQTGRLVARDGERIGPRIFHSTWSSPALGELSGRPLVFFCGGDGVVYAFQALTGAAASGPAETLRRVWRFDCDPAGPKEDVHRYLRNRRESPSNIKSMPVFAGGRLYVTVGGDIWWGKEEAWLKCIDTTGTGDITDRGQAWSYPLKKHCCSTPAVHGGLVFVGDCGRAFHAVDAQTGRACWTHDLDGDVWSSALVADGKVYVGTRRGSLWVFAAGREKRLLATIDLGDPIHGTPVAANGVLYVPTLSRLYAVGDRESSSAKEQPHE
ncbi:MAG: PQQ-binding-like beta-propeller repeat protein [Pirellulales bacterium]|nr:PQQ-binding-like beta-propeller repeat protein [Pirellulales bacterium]